MSSGGCEPRTHVLIFKGSVQTGFNKTFARNLSHWCAIQTWQGLRGLSIFFNISLLTDCLVYGRLNDRCFPVFNRGLENEIIHYSPCASLRLVYI